MSRVRTFLIWSLIGVGLSLSIYGCVQGYRLLGYTPEEAQYAVQLDKQSAKEIAQQVAAEIGAIVGQHYTLPEENRPASDVLIWKIVSVVVGGIGAFLSGLFSRLMARHKKINQAMIRAVEISGDQKVKRKIKAVAEGMGVESYLNKMVKKMT